MSELVVAARSALAAGHREAARTLLSQAIQTDPQHGEAWALLSETLDDPAQQAEARRRAVGLGYVEPAVPPITQSTPPVNSTDAAAQRVARILELRKQLRKIFPGKGQDALYQELHRLEGEQQRHVMQTVTDQQLLDQLIAARTTKGWEVVSQTPTAVQLKQTRHVSVTGLLVFVLLPLIGSIVWLPLLYLAAGGLILVVLDYALKKQGMVYVTAAQIRAGEVREHFGSVPPAPASRRTRFVVALLVAGFVLYGLAQWLGFPVVAPGRSVVPPAASPPLPTVSYLVGGTVSAILLTYENKQGGSEQQATSAPWRLDFVARHGQVVYLSAQNASGRNETVTCDILIDGQAFKHTSSSGAATIATCSGVVP